MTCPQHLRHSLACTARRRSSARRRRLRVKREKGKRVPWRAERVQQVGGATDDGGNVSDMLGAVICTIERFEGGGSMGLGGSGYHCQYGGD